MSRAHVQGFDSNAAQFERIGNPWVSERDRCEFSAPNKKERKQNRRLGKFPKVLVEAKRPDFDRADSPAMQEIWRARRFLNAFKSGLPEGTREVAAAKPAPDPLLVRVQAPSNTELTAGQRQRRGWQKLEFAAKRIAAEAAYASSEAAKLVEKRRLKDIIKAAESRLASLA